MPAKNPHRSADSWRVVEVNYSSWEESEERMFRAVKRIFEKGEHTEEISNNEVAEEKSASKQEAGFSSVAFA